MVYGGVLKLSLLLISDKITDNCQFKYVFQQMVPIKSVFEVPLEHYSTAYLSIGLRLGGVNLVGQEVGSNLAP